MTGDLANGVCDRTWLPPVRTGFERRERGGLSVVRINEGTNPLPMTREKAHEVSFIFSLCFVALSLPQNKDPPCRLRSLKATSLISYPRLVIFKAQRARMVLLRFKSLSIRITSFLLSPTPREFLCHSCNRSPVNQDQPITLLNHPNRRTQKGRDRGARPKNFLLRRNRKPTINRQTAHLTLREMMLPHLRLNLPPSNRILLQLNGSQTNNPFKPSGALRRQCFGFHHAFNPPCTHYIYVLLLPMGNNREE